MQQLISINLLGDILSYSSDKMYDKRFIDTFLVNLNIVLFDLKVVFHLVTQFTLICAFKKNKRSNTLNLTITGL